jgi:hypothetical protein
MENPGMQSEIAELKSVRSQLKAWQWGLFLVLALTLVICVMTLKATVDGLAGTDEARQKLASMLGEQVQKDVVPKIQDVGTEIVKTVDFPGQMKKLNEAAPQVGEVAMKEASVLAEALPEEGQKLLNEKFTAALERQKDTLQAEFPDITEEQLESLMSNLTEEAADQIGDVTANLFSKHIDAMNDIIADTEKIRQTEGKAGKSDDLPTWDVAYLIMDIMHADMKAIDKEMKAATTPPAPKPKAKAAAPKAGKGKK